MTKIFISLFVAATTLFSVNAFALANGAGSSSGAVWHKGDNPANPDQGVKN